MRQFDNLFEKICDWDNLLLAFRKAEKGKREKPNVVAFRFRLEENLLDLQQELREGTYQPGRYTTFFIYEPKKRMISAAPFRDRVVHHAICNVVEPQFERTFIHDTYANRKGKGTHAAIRRCQAMMRRYPWALKCDIRKYFPSIDHALLKDLIARKIACARTQELVFQLIDNSNPQEPVFDFFPGDDLFSAAERRKGLPMGNLTSQFFANFYLSPLDHFVLEKLQASGYIRYVDDFVIFGKNKKTLEKAQRAIAGFLTGFRLTLHPRKCHISPTARGLTFLGQRVFTTHRRLRSENVRRFWRRTRQDVEGFWQKKWTADDLESRLNSWAGHAGQADTWRLRNKVERTLRHSGLNILRSPKGAWRLLQRVS